MASGTFHSQGQSFLLVEPVNTLMVNAPPFPDKQDMNAQISPAHSNSSYFPYSPAQRQLLIADGLIPVQRPVNLKHRAGASLADAVAVLQVPDELPLSGGLYSIFERTSWIMILSRERSATICLSLRFSSSSCRSRRSSDGLRPPYFFFH